MNKITIKKIENNIQKNLIGAWNEFIKLEQTHPSHKNTFINGIHECQQVLMWRELQELKPEKYPSYHE